MDITIKTADYITWTPCKCTITTDNPQLRSITLRSSGTGKVIFITEDKTSARDELHIQVSKANPVSLFIAGKMDATGKSYPSKKDKDTFIEAIDDTHVMKGKKELMIRVRKNVNALTTEERDRFLNALVLLKNRKVYDVLQNMHDAQALKKIHNKNCFLPWHRSYLLNLERNLQRIDASVTIPYWSFDEKAPGLFTPDFIGQTNRGERFAKFSASNPLNAETGFKNIVDRQYIWHPEAQPATTGGNVQRNELLTLGYGKDFSSFANFVEKDPHDNIHNSFNGSISDILNSPHDPLFFLIHANIDRLWAKWQWLYDNFDPAAPRAYPTPLSARPTPNAEGRGGPGDLAQDKLWPWENLPVSVNSDGSASNTFPAAVPPIKNAPGSAPEIWSMLDFQGCFKETNDLYFAYDDIPFYSAVEFPFSKVEDYKNEVLKNVDNENELRKKSLQIFFTNPNANERLKAFSTAGTFTKEEDIKKGHEIFENTAEPIRIRVAALKALCHDITNTEEGVKKLIDILDQNVTAEDHPNTSLELNELKRTSLNLLKANVSDSMTKNLPFYKKTLKKLVDQPNIPDDLREEAATILIFQKDENIQKLLKAELKAPFQKKKIDPVFAMQLLSYDIHSEHFPLFEKLAAGKDIPEVIRMQAIRSLSSDASESNSSLLINLLNDTGESASIRSSAASSLNVIDPKKLLPGLKTILKKEQTDIQLNTLLLNILSYIPDSQNIPQSHRDNELEEALEKMSKNVKDTNFTKVFNRYIQNSSIK